MSRPRKTNRHLPPRVYKDKKSGMYYFVDKNNKYLQLGTVLSKALAEYYKIRPAISSIVTFADLLDKYMAEISPLKAPDTHKTELPAASYLRAAFGEMKPSDITAVDIYQYMDFRSRTAPVRVNREVALLSHMLKKGIRWGTLRVNPCHDVERNPEKPRANYISDDEIKAFLSTDKLPTWIVNYVTLKLLTGLRQTDMLNLKYSDMEVDGILVKASKTKNSTGKELLIEWSDALVSAVEAIKGNSRPVSSAYLFCTRKGQKYTGDGFRSIWHTWMSNAIKANVLTEKFQERDLRAKVGSDTTKGHATLLLGHESDKTTNKYYRRLPEKVRPVK